MQLFQKIVEMDRDIVNEGGYDRIRFKKWVR